MRVNKSTFVDLSLLAKDLAMGDLEYSVFSLLLIIYFSLVVLFGGIGNVLVIYGVLKHKALKMDSVSVLVIVYVASADLFIILFTYVPILSTLVAGRWILGAQFCNTVFIRNIPIACEQCFIALMACHKAMVIWDPLQGGFRKIMMRCLLLNTIICVTAAHILETVFIEGPILMFNRAVFDCFLDGNSVMTSDNVYVKFLPYQIFIFMAVSIITMVVANLTILCLMKKAGRIGHRAIKTISLVCWTFLLSYIPIAFTFYNYMFGTKTMDHSTKAWKESSIVGITTLAVSAVANPIIYSFTNDKFSFFLKKLLRGDLDMFGREWQNKIQPRQPPNLPPPSHRPPP